MRFNFIFRFCNAVYVPVFILSLLNSSNGTLNHPVLVTKKIINNKARYWMTISKPLFPALLFKKKSLGFEKCDTISCSNEYPEFQLFHEY